MTTQLAGGASTQSRARRPLPRGVLSARTLTQIGTRETVEFTYHDGHRETRELINWVVGQAGLLWAAGPYPPEVMRVFTQWEIPGSYGHQAEHQLAEALGEVYADRLVTDDLGVRFFQNAGDACSAAARVCRDYTGRDIIASYGYHGAHADFAHPPQDAGVPERVTRLHHQFEWGDVETMQQAAADAACLMLEVPPVPDAEARAFLQACRAACDANDTPLVIDDTVLGFRLALAGSSEYYGVRPDIVILGKAMSAVGGVAAVLGDAELVGALGEGVFYSTTFGGHPMLCAIAERTVRHLAAYAHGIYGERGHLRQIGQALQDGLNALGVLTVGQPERAVVKFHTDAEWLTWCSQMIGLGVMIHRPNFVTLAHTPADVERTLAAAEAVARDA